MTHIQKKGFFQAHEIRKLLPCQAKGWALEYVTILF